MFSIFTKHTRASAMMLGLGVVIAAAGVVPAANAQPMTREIEYLIHEENPFNSIAFAIKLSLVAVEQDGDWIGWEITAVEFREAGTPNSVWVDEFPTVPSPDGLWWIEHLDPENPTNDEFTMPPHLEGTADNVDPEASDLSYDFVGVTYTPPDPPEEPPFTITAAIDGTFFYIDYPRSRVRYEDEPVEVPPGGSVGLG